MYTLVLYILWLRVPTACVYPWVTHRYPMYTSVLYIPWLTVPTAYGYPWMTHGYPMYTLVLLLYIYSGWGYLLHVRTLWWPIGTLCILWYYMYMHVYTVAKCSCVYPWVTHRSYFGTICSGTYCILCVPLCDPWVTHVYWSNVMAVCTYCTCTFPWVMGNVV